MVKDENYVVIQGWMVSRLKLSGNELLVFALIYGFTQDGNSEFEGSLQYICDWVNSTKPTVRKALSGLADKGIIKKRIDYVQAVQFNRYKVDLLGVKKLIEVSKETIPHGGKETIRGGGKETIPNITILDKSSNNISKDSNAPDKLFLVEGLSKKNNDGSAQKFTERKCLFSESRYFDTEEFKKAFAGTDYGNFAELGYYYEAVLNWSSSGGHKKVDWIATARNFMLGDKREGKLVTKKGIQDGNAINDQNRNGAKIKGNFAGYDANGLFG